MTISGLTVVGVKGLVGAATSNVTQQNLIGAANAERGHVSINGAKTILLVGLDGQGGMMRSDSNILLHIPASHDRAYLVSLPRDSYVRIPAYENGKVPYRGGENKLNSAFAYGSRGLTGDEALAHGFELLSLTIKDLTGITPDAGAIIDFDGFKKVVEVLGKVCMYVDEDTTSIHIGHTADGKRAAPYKINPDGTLHHKNPGVTANFYAKGNHCFTPSQALDFVRQRDLLANNDFDYGRQRHQQQLIKAVLKQVVNDGLSSPRKLPGLLSAVGKTMTVDGGGISLEDWAFAMRGINPDDMITIKTNNGKFNSRSVPGVGSAEILSDTSMQLLQAVKDDTVDNFVIAHPDWVATS
ncbi:LCP family protein [Micromonospora sp. NPDC006766]|uniref:LCP family protein n=1 Tax=Micromonospora sp. NPDC006766 TaxID=3154778 RepID=UPI0033CA01F9